MLQNATYMFEKPRRAFRHSQSRWSTIVQMGFICLAQTQKHTLNVYRSVISKAPTKWLERSEGLLDLSEWNLQNTIVEGDIKYLFDDQELLDPLVYPDIVYKNETKNEIVLIVVRTIGKTVRGRIKEGCDKIDMAIKLTENIRAKGWRCDLYYLLSYGHEDEGTRCEKESANASLKHQDWKRLEHADANIILWEEFFSLLQESEIAPFIDANLQQYTLMPEWV